MKQLDLLKEKRIRELKETHANIKICLSCGSDVDRTANPCRNMEDYIGLCKKCAEKLRCKIYHNRAENKLRHKNYYAKYHIIKRNDHVRNVAKKRGLTATIFLNESFFGCDGHHTDKNTVAYIPSWLHKSIPHNHKKEDSLIRINDWTEQWIDFEKLYKYETLKLKLLTFYDRYLSVVLGN